MVVCSRRGSVSSQVSCTRDCCRAAVTNLTGELVTKYTLSVLLNSNRCGSLWGSVVYRNTGLRGNRFRFSIIKRHVIRNESDWTEESHDTSSQSGGSSPYLRSSLPPQCSYSRPSHCSYTWLAVSAERGLHDPETGHPIFPYTCTISEQGRLH